MKFFVLKFFVLKFLCFEILVFEPFVLVGLLFLRGFFFELLFCFKPLFKFSFFKFLNPLF
ncbi:hypothetical protein FIM68_02350 [Helicobacter pylori]|nr:hypothetical protein FIM68_02350 [Helicobacter pylori]